MKNRISALITFFVIMIFAMCNQVSTNVDVSSQLMKIISKPISNIELGFTTYNVDVSTNQSITTDRGTKIEIPQDAFVDENKQPIKNAVIKFKEITTVGDIIASGITMNYDSAGVKYDFKTAGMFEIAGTTPDGKPIFIQDGKEINIELVSQTGAGDFNLYKLDENKGWQYMGDIASPEEKTEAEMLEYEKAEGGNVHLDDATMQLIQFNPQTDIAIQNVPVDYNKFPELRALNGAVWKYAGNDKTYDEIEASLNAAVDSRELTLVDKNKMLYSLILKKKDKSIEIPIIPVLPEKVYKLALAKMEKERKKLIANNQAPILATDKIDDSLTAESAFSNLARIKSFGTYNCDIIYRFPDLVQVEANFEIGDITQKEQKAVSVYIVSPQEGRIIRYYGTNTSSFVFNPSVSNTLLAFFEDNTVMIFDKNDFQQLDIRQLMNDKKYSFKFKPYSQKVKTVADINQIFATL